MLLQDNNCLALTRRENECVCVCERERERGYVCDVSIDGPMH